jgi:hypothetical protein
MPQQEVFERGFEGLGKAEKLPRFFLFKDEARKTPATGYRKSPSILKIHHETWIFFRRQTKLKVKLEFQSNEDDSRCVFLQSIVNIRRDFRREIARFPDLRKDA